MKPRPVVSFHVCALELQSIFKMQCSAQAASITHSGVKCLLFPGLWDKCPHLFLVCVEQWASITHLRVQMSLFLSRVVRQMSQPISCLCWTLKWPPNSPLNCHFYQSINFIMNKLVSAQHKNVKTFAVPVYGHVYIDFCSSSLWTCLHHMVILLS